MTVYRCTTCEKFKRPDRSAIKEGDKVNFVKSTQRGRSVRMSTRTGRVLQVLDETVTVAYRGTCYRLNKEGVTPEDAPSQLTYALAGTCECSVEA